MRLIEMDYFQRLLVHMNRLRDENTQLQKRVAELEAQPAPAQQVGPVSAQVRYRRPEKGQPDWSVWQPAPIMLNRPYGEIDSRGWEVEYRLLYTTPQPAEQSTFTVGTDLSDGKLTVVVVKHENDTAWVIHSEVIQLAKQQPDVTQLLKALESAQKEAVYGLNHASNRIQASAALGRVSTVCDVALAAYRKGVQI